LDEDEIWAEVEYDVGYLEVNAVEVSYTQVNQVTNNQIPQMQHHRRHFNCRPIPFLMSIVEFEIIFASFPCQIAILVVNYFIFVALTFADVI
jgi:hypothetical protein